MRAVGAVARRRKRRAGRSRALRMDSRASAKDRELRPNCFPAASPARVARGEEFRKRYWALAPRSQGNGNEKEDRQEDQAIAEEGREARRQALDEEVGQKAGAIAQEDGPQEQEVESCPA